MALVLGDSSKEDFVHVIGDGLIAPPGTNDLEEATVTDDTIRTFGRVDIIHAGAGHDFIDSGTENDTVFAEAGDDTVWGDAGSDSIDGGDGDDYLWAFTPSPTKADGDDTLIGGNGDDTLIGDDGNDDMWGGSGADLFVLDREHRALPAQNDEIFDFDAAEGDQIDVSDWNIATAETLRAIAEIEGDTVFLTRWVADKPQIVSLYDVADIDALFANAVFSTDTTGSTNLNPQNFYGPAGASDLFGGLGDDVMFNFDNTNEGLVPTPRMFGGPGMDTITGGNTDDILVGGTEADVLDGAGGRDTASYVGAQSGVLVDLEAGTGTFSDAAGDILMNIENLAGSDAGDWLYGDATDNRIDGAGSGDVMRGRDGADSLFGDGGNDWIGGGQGDDLMEGGDGRDSLYGYGGDDSMIGGRGDDQLYGFVGNDTLAGTDGNNTLEGGWGDDFLFGGFGNDTMTGDGGADVFGQSSAVWGDDVITDFRRGVDVIELGLTSFAQLTGAVSVVGGNTVIDLGAVINAGLSGSLTLEGVTGRLDEADFGL